MKEIITADLKTAMKNKDKVKIDTLRGILTSIGSPSSLKVFNEALFNGIYYSNL